MSNRSFCVFLAAVLMLMGAAASALMKRVPADQASAQEVSATIQKEEALTMPVSGEIIGRFGARYSQEHGQWDMEEETTIRVDAQEVQAPLSGTVESVASAKEGGSTIILQCNGLWISLTPVCGVRVFEGSSVKQGEILGWAEGCLTIRAEKDGRAIDLLAVGKTHSF